MATTVTLIGTGNSGSNTSAAASYSAPGVAGIFVFICAVENTAGGGTNPITSLTDSQGRSTAASFSARYSPTPNTVGDGVAVTYFSVGTSVITAGTITIATSANARKAWAIYHIAGFPSTGYGSAGLDAFGVGATTLTPSKLEAFNSVQTGDVIIGFLGLESSTAPTLDSDTVNGAWSSPQTFAVNNGGSQTTSVGLATQYKIGTYTGSTTPAQPQYNPTLVTTARDGLIGAIGFPALQPPNPAAAPTVVSTTDTTAALTWVAPFNHWAISNYIIEYRVNGSGAWTQQSMGSAALSGTVTGPLTPGTLYDFNIKAVNLYGTSTTGAIASATTSTSSVSASITAGVISAATTALSPSVTSSVSTSITAGVISAATTALSPSVTSAVFTGITAPVVSTSSTLYGATPLAVASTGITSPVVTSPFLTASPAVLLSTRSYFRPSSDSSVGSWTITPLWSKVGEVVPYDGDYISSEVITSGTTSIAKLALTT